MRATPFCRPSAASSALGAVMDTAPGHPEIARFVAPNPGAMTLAGTNSYVVGSGPAYVIDPGPGGRGPCRRASRGGGAARSGSAGFS